MLGRRLVCDPVDILGRITMVKLGLVIELEKKPYLI